MQLTSVRKPSLQQWNDLMAPAPGQATPVVPGLRADEPLPHSVDEFRQQVAALDFHPIDPFVASVAGSVGANQNEMPKGETTVAVRVPSYYAEDVEVMMGTQNGPGAPMLLILPGIHSGGDSSHNLLLRKLAVERGMNYVALPNSMNAAMLDDKPVYHPGNPRVDALWTRELLANLKEQYPEFFGSVSVAGYSYGALQAANLVRLDEEGGERLIDGGMVAISPPENLEHSMHQLDELRASYANGSATVADTGLQYKYDVKKFGYERFMESGLSKHNSENNVDEREIADKYGSRDSLKSLVERVDTQFGHNLLPMNTEEYKQANLIEKYRMRQEHNRIVDNITYEQLSKDWMSKDDWLAQQGITPAQLAERYSFSNALAAVNDTPALVVASADDYILSGADVDALRKMKTGELEISRVFDVGGHVGLDWNPRIAETLIDFAVAAKDY